MNFKVTLSFSNDTHEFGADKDTYIGKLVERIIDTIGVHYNGLSFGTKFIGYDYQLHKKLSDYEDFKGMSFINCFIAHSSFNYRHAQYKINIQYSIINTIKYFHLLKIGMKVIQLI